MDSRRGLPPSKQKCWVAAIEKENHLRLKWFKKNENRLEEIANNVRQSTDLHEKAKEALNEEILKRYQNVERHSVIVKEPETPVMTEPILDIMKPVDPQVTKLLYTGENKDGRHNYLHERTKLLPEQRYYFTETTNFQYGWHMFDFSRTMEKTGFGVKSVIKESFYRRRGAERDPNWYRQPATLCPTICS